MADTHPDIIIALAGNPNSGKTSLFNALTGSRQHVGNWAGVTVEHKEGIVTRESTDPDGTPFTQTYRLIDLPGIYSLSTYSEEERIARDFLIDNKVDVIIDVVDAGNLERNLYLTTQLLELGIPVVVALNMVDMAEQMGIGIDLPKFSEMLGVRAVTTVASREEGIDALLEAAAEATNCALSDPPRSARLDIELEIEISRLEEKLIFSPGVTIPPRWLILKSLEGDKDILARLLSSLENPETAEAHIDATRKHLEEQFRDDLEMVIADGRYGFIGGLMREVVTKREPKNRFQMTEAIDNVLLHKWAGLPIFLLMMWLTFKLTFGVGGQLVGVIDHWITMFSRWTTSVLPHGPISSLITNGAIPGVGGVLVFLPNIIVMFAVISFLEDSGYMARAAFLMDRAMHTLGLHGKSFIPLLMGFGCNVPAIMATRTLDTREDRLVTILINPFMSCTARLPIYMLLASVFFKTQGALVIFSIYILGILLAVVSGKLFRRFLFKKAASPFVMELPPYRFPTLKGTILHVWDKVSQFLSRAGTVILASAIVVWALSSMPFGTKFGSEHSLVGMLGKFLQPIVQPLGFDWKGAVALIFGAASKEVVVSTLGVLGGAGATTHSEQSMSTAIAGMFTPLTAYTFMVVSLIYLPCVATIAAIRRETGSWKWTLFSAGYSLTVAYILGFLTYQVGKLLGLG